MISRAHNAREVLRGVQQLANQHVARTFLNCDCSGSEVDSGTSFLGSREASGHSSFMDRKQGSSRHFMSTPSSSDLKTQDWSPFQLDSRRSLKTSSLFQVPSIKPLCKNVCRQRISVVKSFVEPAFNSLASLNFFFMYPFSPRAIHLLICNPLQID